MRVDLFDFELPPERIALAPASPRETARLLVVAADGGLADRQIGDLPEILRPGDALVVNDTKVIAARLVGVRARGEGVAAIEATLIKRLDASRWRALARPAKKLKVGERIRFGDGRESGACLLGALDAEVEAKGDAGEVTLAFSLHGAALDEAIDLGAPHRKRRRRERRRPALRGRDGDLHHARLPLSGGRCAADQFPFAALDLVHVGQRIQRA